jgi:hypothetical protein
MRFKQYLAEYYGGDMDNYAYSMDAGPVSTPNQRASINNLFAEDFEKPVLSPESGIQKIRKTLSDFDFQFPALYEADSDGDEIVFQLNDVDFLYVIYYLTDDGRYDFYAELTDEAGINEIMSEEDEEE